jgi:hypothetical protein
MNPEKPNERSCPPEAAFVELLQGDPEPDLVREVHDHADDCMRCRELIAALARGLGSSSSQPTGGDASEPPDARRIPAAVVTLPPGARVSRYVLGRVIGMGGMGVVYAASDPDLHRPLAVKVLRADLPGHPSAQQRLLMREARAMARLQHPNVLTIYEVGTFEDRVFIAMEYMSGGTLAAWLRAAARDWRSIVAAFAAAGDGLQAAHEAGLIHRDFKPDNVLRADNGRICVADFGLARMLDECLLNDVTGRSAEASTLSSGITRTGALIGTPRYMAPEQLAGGPVDARTDIFSFCVALWEALVGAPPFPGISVEELRGAMERELVAPATAPRQVPARVLNVVRRGLRIDPAARPADMRTLLAALRRAARPRALRLAAAALVAVVFAGGVGLTATSQKAAREALRPRRALAIMPLVNRSGDPASDWLGPALAEQKHTS